MDYNWDFATLFQNWRVFWIGLQGTLLMFGVTAVLGMSGGLIIGIMRYMKTPILAWPARAFVEIFRNVPVLVQIIWFYYAFPILTGVAPGLVETVGIIGVIRTANVRHGDDHDGDTTLLEEFPGNDGHLLFLLGGDHVSIIIDQTPGLGEWVLPPGKSNRQQGETKDETQKGYEDFL